MKINPRILIGLLLVVGGIFAVVYGGFSYTTDRHSADLGPIEVSVNEQERVNIPMWAGIAAIAAGAVTLAVGRSRR